MKVPVKKYSDVDWIMQAKNTELTSNFVISLSCSLFCFLIVSYG